MKVWMTVFLAAASVLAGCAMEKPQVRRGKVADIKLQCFLTASEEESAQVKKHIANL